MAFEYRPNRSAPEPHPSSRSTTAAFFSRRLAPGANPRSWWNTRTKGASTCALGLDDSARERFPATAPEPKNARPWDPPPPSPPRPPPWPPLGVEPAAARVETAVVLARPLDPDEPEPPHLGEVEHRARRARLPAPGRTFDEE